MTPQSQNAFCLKLFDDVQDRSSKEWGQLFQTLKPTNYELFCLTSKQDEVFLAFKLAHRLTSFSKWLLRPTVGIVSFILFLIILLPQGNQAIFSIGENWGSVIQGAVVYLVLPLALVSDNLINSEWMDIIMIPMSALMAAIILAAISLVSLSSAMALQYFATIARFGWELRWKLMRTFFCDVDVDLRPNNGDKAHVAVFSIKRRGLAHSNITSHPEALNALIAILNSKRM